MTRRLYGSRPDTSPHATVPPVGGHVGARSELWQALEQESRPYLNPDS